MSDPDDTSDDESAGREWAELDELYGEWIARDVNDRLQERSEHYRHAHHRTLLDSVTDFLNGSNSAEECNNPRCDVPAFDTEDRQASWWERWFRHSGNDEGSSGSSD